MFEKFPSLTRFSHGWTITEKLDGTNACVLILPVEGDIVTSPSDVDYTYNINELASCARLDGFVVLAQSRNKLITPADDNAGFARFVADNAEALVATLGEGRHFGEWVGKGIQRGYGLDQKVFALFNAGRWKDTVLPDRVTTVPVLTSGYIDNPKGAADEAMTLLREKGSVFAPGFMNAEGIVMHHGPSRTSFKKTFDYDEKGKWAENEARRQQ